MINKIHQGDWITVLQTLAGKSVNCCVTSPPYYGLRDYGVAGSIWPEIEYSILGFKIVVPAMVCCLGLESTPEAYIGHLVYGFRQVHRVMKDDGTLWLNIGDSYAATSKNRTEEQANKNSGLSGGLKTQSSILKQQNKVTKGLKQKDLIGIPWMLAFALRDDGWYLRQDIIWHKPNPMPESVTDRCTKAHEYFFLFSKNHKYYFDAKAIQTKVVESSIKRLSQDIDNQVGSVRVPW